MRVKRLNASCQTFSVIPLTLKRAREALTISRFCTVGIDRLWFRVILQYIEKIYETSRTFSRNTCIKHPS